MDRFAASPCSNPEWTLDEAMAAFSQMGLTKFEAFTEWTNARLDIDADPAAYVRTAARHGMRFASMHLTSITEDFDASLARAVRAARFARDIGAGVVLFKAKTRELYVRAARAFLDATADLNVTPVLQNHKGTAVSSLDDFRDVLDGIGDPRMKALLEVGHFYAVGTAWPEAYALLRGRIALVHLKDMAGGEPVLFGTGEVDFRGLFARLNDDGYDGDFVIELEGECRTDLLNHHREANDLLLRMLEA